jgi:hypothetical protein
MFRSRPRAIRAVSTGNGQGRADAEALDSAYVVRQPRAWSKGIPMEPQRCKLLDSSTLRSLVEDLPTACAQARSSPGQFEQIFDSVVRDARPESRNLDDANAEWLTQRASEADVSPALRRALAKTFPEIVKSSRFLSVLVADAAEEKESLELLRQHSEVREPREYLIEMLLRSASAAVRKVGARAATRWGLLLTVAAAVLIHDREEDELETLAATSGRHSRLREAIALIAVCRSTPATAAAAVDALAAAGPSLCWLRCDPRVGSLRVHGKFPGCDDLARMPNSHDLLTKTLNILFGAKRLDLAVPILLDRSPRTIADLLRDEIKGWQSSPEIVQLLVRACPDIEPGIVADLCGLFLPVPAEPRNHLSSREYLPWQRSVPYGGVPGRMLAAFVSRIASLIPRTEDPFEGVDCWFALKQGLGELSEAFRASPAGQVAEKLAELEDREAALAVYLAWFERYAAPTDWDGIFVVQSVPVHPNRLDVFWPRVSTEMAAEIVADVFADHGWMLPRVPRPDWSQILTRIALSSAATGVRADAVALKILAGEDVPEICDTAVLTRALQRLIKGGQLPSSALPVLLQFLKSSDEQLLGDTAGLSFVLGPVIDHAARTGDLDGEGGVERLTRLRRRLFEAIARLPLDEARSRIARMTPRLAERLAASTKTPRPLRVVAIFRAVEASDFDPKRCDVSDDVAVIADAFVELRRVPSPRMKAAEYLVRVALNAIVHEPPQIDDFDQQSMPHFRLRDGLRDTLNAYPEVAAFAADHLATALSRSLRGFLSNGMPSQDKAPAVAWLRAIGKLRDPRPATVLEQNVPSLASAGLAEVAEEALREARMADEASMGPRVVLAIRNLWQG